MHQQEQFLPPLHQSSRGTPAVLLHQCQMTKLTIRMLRCSTSASRRTSLVSPPPALEAFRRWKSPHPPSSPGCPPWPRSTTTTSTRRQTWRTRYAYVMQFSTFFWCKSNFSSVSQNHTRIIIGLRFCQIEECRLTTCGILMGRAECLSGNKRETRHKQSQVRAAAKQLLSLVPLDMLPSCVLRIY